MKKIISTWVHDNISAAKEKAASYCDLVLWVWGEVFWWTLHCKSCLFSQKQRKWVLSFFSKNEKENRNKAQKLIKLAATEMKAFWCNLLKGKCCEINSNQKLIKVDAIGAVKECLITCIELNRHGCQRKDTRGIKFK